MHFSLMLTRGMRDKGFGYPGVPRLMLEGIEGDSSEDPGLQVSMVRDRPISMTHEPTNTYSESSHALLSSFISGECAPLYSSL